MGFEPLILSFVPPHVLIVVGIVSILAGVLNIIIGMRKLF
jgi:hypothetical protein